MLLVLILSMGIEGSMILITKSVCVCVIRPKKQEQNKSGCGGVGYNFEVVDRMCAGFRVSPRCTLTPSPRIVVLPSVHHHGPRPHLFRAPKNIAYSAALLVLTAVGCLAPPRLSLVSAPDVVLISLCLALCLCLS